MARSRLDLQYILEQITPEVWFQPPPSLRLTYPTIIYSRDYHFTAHADNKRYAHLKRYQVTVISRDSDSDLPDKVAELPYTNFTRAFNADGLHHDIFDLYF